MADTLTPNTKLTNQTEGGNSNTWGVIADSNFEQIDNKFGDVTTITTTGGNTVLSDVQEIVNAIVISGALVTDANIVFSGRGGTWIVENLTAGSFAVTAKVSGQSGVAIPQGGAAVVFCNGTDIVAGNPAASASAEVAIASASTCDILAAASEFIAISGTTTITSFGSGASKKRFVRATGAFKITHNATSLILPGAKDITAAAGDTFLLISDASGNVRVFSYQRAVVPPNALPVGVMMPYAGSTEPAGWLFCYGQAVSRTTYAALYATIGIAYGSGDATTTFNLPDRRGRVSIGKDNMGGSAAGRITTSGSSIDGTTLGASGGAQWISIVQANLPSVNLSASSITATSTTNVTISNGTGQIKTSGGGIASGTNTTNWGQVDITASATTTTAIGGNVPLGGSGTPLVTVMPSLVDNVIIFTGV